MIEKKITYIGLKKKQKTPIYEILVKNLWK